ncbi:MAG TPA: RMD1 family protein [Fibrobacteria bacterium]|nr:RMD1 family protein [Fibrobacteria bacterium]
MQTETRHILTIRAFQIAEGIDIRRCRTEFPGELIAAAPGELFYRRKAASPDGTGEREEGYLYVMDYGVVTFAGHGEEEMAAVLDRLRPFCENLLDKRMGEDFRVHADGQELGFTFNDIHLPAFNSDVLRIIMLYVGQSAALDHYEAVVDRLLAEAGRVSQELERYGRLKTSRRNVQKFIGRTLGIRNRLVDNLYIMDAPDITWENEYLDKIDRGMKKTFDIFERFRSLDYQLREIKENLELFAELLQFRQSNMLEWIIIALFLIETVNLFR